MKITNNLNLPAPLVSAIEAQKYDRGDSQLSVTDLVNPPQITYLYRTFDDQLVEDASQRIWMLLGQSIHQILEMAGDQATGEVRLFADYPQDVRISGKFDRLVVEDDTLVDYKVTSSYSVKGGEVKPEWEKQLNYYRWLCLKNGIKVRNLKIVAILRDWNKHGLRDENYPRQSVVSLDVEVWNELLLETALDKDIEEHMVALEGNPRPCTDEERWHVPGKVALMKQGRKSAIKLFDTKDDLVTHCLNTGVMVHDDNEDEQFKDKAMYIEERPTTYRRCEDYCAVSEFCEQWKNENN